MKPILETPLVRSAGTSITAFERREAAFPWNWHYHPEIELTLIRSGRGNRLVGDHSASYGALDLVLLGPNLPHTWSSTDAGQRRKPGGHRAVVIQFLPGVLTEPQRGLPEFAAIAALLAESVRGLRFSAGTAQRLEDRMRAMASRAGIYRWLALMRILADLAGSDRQPLASEKYLHRRSSASGSRLERVTAHLENHFREELPLAEAARVAGLTPGAFSKFFRKMTRKTFVDYRNTLRIREACRALAETDRPITEIAYACGFSNLANFNRRFLRETGVVPRDYRRTFNPPA